MYLSPVFFVGVHYILDSAEQLIQRYQFKIQILVGGKVSWGESYSAYCGKKMELLKSKYPFCFWANPSDFFHEGPMVNLGADVALMPSRFEPGGIVQHEFFIAGTPVLGSFYKVCMSLHFHFLLCFHVSMVACFYIRTSLHFYILCLNGLIVQVLCLHFYV